MTVSIVVSFSSLSNTIPPFNLAGELLNNGFLNIKLLLFSYSCTVIIV